MIVGGCTQVDWEGETGCLESPWDLGHTTLNPLTTGMVQVVCLRPLSYATHLFLLDAASLGSWLACVHKPHLLIFPSSKSTISPTRRCQLVPDGAQGS